MKTWGDGYREPQTLLAVHALARTAGVAVAARSTRVQVEPTSGVAYVSMGQESGPVAVVLPGLNDGLAPLWDAHHWVPDPPAELGYLSIRVLSYPRSLPEATTTSSLAGVTAAFLREIGDGPAIVSGHSMGAMIATHLAADEPDLVAALILSGGMLQADQRFDARLAYWENLITAGRWQEFHRDTIAASYSQPEARRRVRLLEALPTPNVDHNVDRHLALSAACRGHDGRAAAARISQPTLVVGAESDEVVSIGLVREFADAIPGSVLEVIPSVGHGFTEESPDLYARVVDRFLADVSSPSLQSALAGPAR